MDTRGSRPGLLGWFVAVGVGFSATLLSFGSERMLGSPIVLFWVVTVAAGLCVVAASIVLVIGFRRSVAEVAFAGAALWATSALPLVHGLTAPGVLYGENTAVVIGAFLALPFALVSGLPLVAPRLTIARRAAQHWRLWTLVSVSTTALVCGFLLLAPRALPAPAGASPVPVAVSGICLVAFLAMSWRQLTLYWVSRRRAALFTSMAYLLLATTAVVWWQTDSFTIGWWMIHGADITGVFLGCYGAARSARLSKGVEAVLAPILSRDPLVALEFGLAPVVHGFVADLDAKDPVTRDHVIRTAEAAMRVGQALGMPFTRLRHLGLAALLHDIGKLGVPDEILNKPGRLDDAEYAIMQRHTEIGARILEGVPMLAPAAPFVRAHHERIDGGGYPDSLLGWAIPLEARIISVCDAFDAMANTRQYRSGMGTDRAASVLREHAGSQWDEAVVQVAISVLQDLHGTQAALAHVGRTSPEVSLSTDNVHRCVCGDALPVSSMV